MASNKISNKLEKVNESFTINMYDNGYMIEISGKDSQGEWKNSKILCSTLNELLELVKEATELSKDE
jgi:hypothetical protein